MELSNMELVNGIVKHLAYVNRSVFNESYKVRQ